VTRRHAGFRIARCCAAGCFCTRCCSSAASSSWPRMGGVSASRATFLHARHPPSTPAASRAWLAQSPPSGAIRAARRQTSSQRRHRRRSPRNSNAHAVENGRGHDQRGPIQDRDRQQREPNENEAPVHAGIIRRASTRRCWTSALPSLRWWLGRRNLASCGYYRWHPACPGSYLDDMGRLAAASSHFGRGPLLPHRSLHHWLLHPESLALKVRQLPASGQVR